MNNNYQLVISDMLIPICNIYEAEAENTDQGEGTVAVGAFDIGWTFFTA